MYTYKVQSIINMHHIIPEKNITKYKGLKLKTHQNGYTKHDHHQYISCTYIFMYLSFEFTQLLLAGILCSLEMFALKLYKILESNINVIYIFCKYYVTE